MISTKKLKYLRKPLKEASKFYIQPFRQLSTHNPIMPTTYDTFIIIFAKNFILGMVKTIYIYPFFVTLRELN